ncbi:YidC/Oxa1 family membrane protein insertase [Streptococcus henryi]|uniref:Membrane protein insertase YidC n=1 Tax=Streptococcus henryi TaxID=439219 RepID=A0A1G6BDY4_9STRE|nr:membrane protein insertase YidC [Streptococcus henryi]SDB18833.1 YidC/Oxa1 family membrane protein insertase [Streptococcus henryi]
MKKKLNRIFLSGLGLSMLLLLSGCVQTTKENGQIVPTGEGWVYNLLVRPMGSVIQFFATDMGLGFGVAVILVTIIVRFLILPLGLYQSWKASYQSEKMAYLKPIFEPINERMRTATSQEEKLAAQSELMAAQKENGVNPLGGMGCLPLLIQMPFFTAMYYAARFTDGVAESSFLGMDLGQRSLILTGVIAVLYFGQSWLSVQGVAEEQKAQMKSMMFMMPLMMIFMSINLPAGVGLYWLVGGFFSIFQQLITMYIIKPRLRKKIADEFEKNPPKAYKTTKARKDVTQASDTTVQSAITTNNKRRNAGKQRKRK